MNVSGGFGHDGSVSLYPDKVIIYPAHRLIPWSDELNTPLTKEILINDMEAIHFQLARSSHPGFIEFASKNPLEVVRVKEIKKFLIYAENLGDHIEFHDVPFENRVYFNVNEAYQFNELKNRIEAMMGEIREHNCKPEFVADEIKKLAGLRDAGILTHEEFEAKKKQLLNL